MLLAIDPGAHQGWALFNIKTHRLVHCGLGIVDHRDFRNVVDLDRCVIERPTLYKGGKARPADVITLALRAGEAAGLVRAAWGVDAEYVEPRSWKGQVPKAEHNARTWALLKDDEKDQVTVCLKGIAPSKRNNVLDAIGLGLWAVGRQGR